MRKRIELRNRRIAALGGWIARGRNERATSARRLLDLIAA